MEELSLPYPVEYIQPLLKVLGFNASHVPAEWEDTGDAESGPMLSGHEAYDVWTKNEVSIYVVDGMVVEIERNQPGPDDDLPL